MGRLRAECRRGACPTLLRVLACERKGTTSRTPTSCKPMACPLKPVAALAILLRLTGIAAFSPIGTADAGPAPIPISYIDITQQAGSTQVPV